MENREGEPSNSYRVYVLVFVTSFVVALAFMPFVFSSDETDDGGGENLRPISTETGSPLEDGATNSNSTSVASVTVPPDEAVEGIVSTDKADEQNASFTGLIIEHCQMKLEHPTDWKTGENEYGATYVANFDTGNEPPSHGLIVELCPLREGNFDSGEPFTFAGGYEGEIFYGGIYGADEPDHSIDLLYHDNRVTWFLSAEFEEPTTDDNPATAAFFAIVESIEYHDSGFYSNDDLSDEHPTESISVIDPLFITYACNDRQNSDYDRAVEQWGYLTHGGKDLICREFLNGDYDFVLHHQRLIESEIDMLLQKHLSRSDSTRLNHIYDQDPEALYRSAATAGGLVPGQPFGSFALDRMSYEKMDLIYHAYVGSHETLSYAGLYSFIADWAEEEGRLPAGYRNAGEILAPSLTGTRDTHFSRRLRAVRDSRTQFLMIGSVLEAVHESRSSRWRVMEREYAQMYDTYNLVGGRADFWFDEWLVENANQFLDAYWSNQDWTGHNND